MRGYTHIVLKARGPGFRRWPILMAENAKGLHLLTDRLYVRASGLCIN